MPVKKIAKDAVPPYRGKVSSVTSSQEFREACMIMSNGLKPNEAVFVTKPSDAKVKNWGAIMSRVLKAKLKQLNISGLDVFTKGQDEVYIVGK